MAREKIVTQAVRVRLRVRRECLEWRRTLFFCLSGFFHIRFMGMSRGVVEIVRKRKDSDSGGRDWGVTGFFREWEVLLSSKKKEKKVWKTKKILWCWMVSCENDFRAEIWDFISVLLREAKQSSAGIGIAFLKGLFGFCWGWNSELLVYGNLRRRLWGCEMFLSIFSVIWVEVEGVNASEAAKLLYHESFGNKVWWLRLISPHFSETWDWMRWRLTFCLLGWEFSTSTSELLGSF